MFRNWLSDLRKYLIVSGAVLFAAVGVGRAQQQLPPADAPAPATPAPAAAAPAPAAAAAPTDVQAQLAAQQKRIEELETLIRSGQVRPAAADAAAGDGKDDPKPLTDADVKKIVGDYLKENPGANLNNGVQTGFELGKGFVVRSAPNPKWSNWDDQSKIPFELRIRGRLQADYYFYQVDDRTNHQTGKAANGGNNSALTSISWKSSASV